LRALQRLVFRVQLDRTLNEQGLGFGMARIGQATLDRAHGLTRFMIVEANALGAEVRIDYVDLVAFADRLIRTFGFASATVDAVGGDMRCHSNLREQSRARFIGRKDSPVKSAVNA
jgi:hypothetical protein